MKKILFVIYALLVTVVLMRCAPKNKEDQPAGDVVIPASSQLTEQQKAEGWQLLFDGQTTNGWQIFKARENNTWEVADGVLHCKALDESVSGVGDKRADIMTIAEYENFELAFDWKIAKEGNTGVMFRVTEEFEQPYYTGPEFQLMDDPSFPNETPDHLTGSNYGMHAAGKTKIKPAGEWNTSKLVVNKNHVEHWLNGDKVVEYELNSPEWLALKKAGKWNEATGYGAPTKGHIVLQDHGSEAWFRNIMIKPL